jgi:hypothetical protein
MTHTINLDWSRLLGFDQAQDPREGDANAAVDRPHLSQLGTKVGGKSGSKPGQGGTGFACGPRALHARLRRSTI